LDPKKFLLKKLSCFSFAKERSSFHSYQKPSVLLFLLLLLVFICLDLRSDLLIFIYQGVFLPLDHFGFPQKSWIKKFEWCWKREKDLCKKVVQKGACLDCGLDFFMSCLMSF
jgi:hypothetical protein